jgi:histidyl-tRNA synthetase
MFGQTQMPGVGFGMGDVTLMDFLKVHGLLPEVKSHVDILVGLFDAEMLVQNQQLARHLRSAGFKVESVLKQQKLGKQFELADKRGIPLVVLQGPDEALLEQVSVKDLRTGAQENVHMENLIDWLQTQLA